MHPKLLVRVVEMFEELFDTEECAELGGDFYINDQTPIVLARVVEASWDAMRHSGETESKEGEG